jgi:hypothetical protein
VRTTEWDSMMPLPVAGFHLGRFVEKDDKTPGGVTVAAYANADRQIGRRACCKQLAMA